jgi:hypothetical protein
MGEIKAGYLLEKVTLKLLNSFRKKTNQCENLVRNKDLIQNINEVPNKTKNSWLYPTDQFGKMETVFYAQFITHRLRMNPKTEPFVLLLMAILI